LGKLLNLGLENFEVGFWVEGFSSGVLDEFRGGIATAVGVNLFPQPAKEGLVVVIFHRSREGRNIPIRSLPKLGRGQIA